MFGVQLCATNNCDFNTSSMSLHFDLLASDPASGAIANLIRACSYLPRAVKYNYRYLYKEQVWTHPVHVLSSHESSHDCSIQYTVKSV